jgi:hypothetical protein
MEVEVITTKRRIYQIGHSEHDLGRKNVTVKED